MVPTGMISYIHYLWAKAVGSEILVKNHNHKNHGDNKFKEHDVITIQEVTTNPVTMNDKAQFNKAIKSQ